MKSYDLVPYHIQRIQNANAHYLMLEITINNAIFLLQPFWLYFPHTLAVSPKTTNPYRNPSIPRENEWNTFFTNFITVVKFAIPMTFDDVSTKIARSMPPKRMGKKTVSRDFIIERQSAVSIFCVWDCYFCCCCCCSSSFLFFWFLLLVFYFLFHVFIYFVFLFWCSCCFLLLPRITPLSSILRQFFPWSCILWSEQCSSFCQVPNSIH